MRPRQPTLPALPIALAWSIVASTLPSFAKGSPEVAALTSLNACGAPGALSLTLDEKALAAPGGFRSGTNSGTILFRPTTIAVAVSSEGLTSASQNVGLAAATHTLLVVHGGYPTDPAPLAQWALEQSPAAQEPAPAREDESCCEDRDGAPSHTPDCSAPADAAPESDSAAKHDQALAEFLSTQDRSPLEITVIDLTPVLLEHEPSPTAGGHDLYLLSLLPPHFGQIHLGGTPMETPAATMSSPIQSRGRSLTVSGTGWEIAYELTDSESAPGSRNLMVLHPSPSGGVALQHIPLNAMPKAAD